MPETDAPGDGRVVGRFAPATLRAAAWTVISIVRARRVLRSDGVRGRIPSPPPLPIGATRGVLGVLRRMDPTCLERATVLQTWLTAHDVHAEVVIGVRGAGDDRAAHAWVETGRRSAEAAGYIEIHRIGPV